MQAVPWKSTLTTREVFHSNDPQRFRNAKFQLVYATYLFTDSAMRKQPRQWREIHRRILPQAANFFAPMPPLQ